MKGRTVADGRRQRQWYTRDQVTSPTMSNDSLMALLTVSAAERRKIISWDVESVYLLADQDDFIVVKLTGESVDVLCDVDNGYKEYVTLEKGKKVLYVQLLKALYGCLRSALLWYELYTTKLKSMGFELNPYDPCVANKTINEKQCFIGYYVDDDIATHDSDKVLKQVAETVEKQVGKITVTTGDEHTFLGMNIKFNDNGTVTIDMQDCVKETLTDFPDKLRNKAASPARPDLFFVNNASPKLTQERSDIFHSIVMKLMWISQRCRLDITTAIAFLSTRVSRSTEQDWLKLKRVLEFLNGTFSDGLTLRAESLTELINFADVSFAVHPDMRSPTGGGASFGRGVFLPMSKKQRINTGSSTEGEVVGVSDYAPNTIWLLKFLEGQGYKQNLCLLYQDNEAAIKMLQNGKKSSTSRRTRRLDVGLFNIKDKLRQHNIEVRYCPTENMVADFFTKPLQGTHFRKLRRLILGMDAMSTLELGVPSDHIPKECVGTSLRSMQSLASHQSREKIPVGLEEQKARTYADIVTRK